MSATLKIIIGLVILAVGLALLLDLVPGLQLGALSAFVTVLKGTIPVLLVLAGLFIIWLELDELKKQKAVKK